MSVSYELRTMGINRYGFKHHSLISDVVIVRLKYFLIKSEALFLDRFIFKVLFSYNFILFFILLAYSTTILEKFLKLQLL